MIDFLKKVLLFAKLSAEDLAHLAEIVTKYPSSRESRPDSSERPRQQVSARLGRKKPHGVG